jgi:hypothetical protein
MVLKSKENEFGAWSFLVGVILAIVIGISTVLLPFPELTRYSPPIYGILVILGFIIGFWNVPTGKDSQSFLISGAILVIVSRFGMDSVTGSLIGIGIGDLVSSVFGALLVLFVPATIIVALKSVFSIAKV